MTKPTSKQVQEFMGVATKTILGVTIVIIGWFVSRWMERMETKQDAIHEKVSTMDGDHRELEGRVKRNSEDIKVLLDKAHTHK